MKKAKDLVGVLDERDRKVRVRRRSLAAKLISIEGKVCCIPPIGRSLSDSWNMAIGNLLVDLVGKWLYLMPAFLAETPVDEIRVAADRAGRRHSDCRDPPREHGRFMAHGSNGNYRNIRMIESRACCTLNVRNPCCQPNAITV